MTGKKHRKEIAAGNLEHYSVAGAWFEAHSSLCLVTGSIFAEYKEAAERLGDGNATFQEIQRGERGSWSDFFSTSPILSYLPQVSSPGRT